MLGQEWLLAALQLLLSVVLAADQTYMSAAAVFCWIACGFWAFYLAFGFKEGYVKN